MKSSKHAFLAVILISLVLAACQPIVQTPLPTATTQPIETTEPEPTAVPPEPVEEDPMSWWNEVVFYEIFVRSFKDSDGDGIGDFQGIISQLDYLNDGYPNTTDDLGIGGIWLMPIMPSPSYHGYDVTNYQTVNPDYGTLADFKQLLEECHVRGIRVVIDFVVNHTSSEHPWFLSSQDPTSGFRNWYVWEEQNPRKPGPWGQNAWYEAGGYYYYAPFWSGMPDLNFHEPMVTKAMYNATEFWLDLGVDGFRVDAARYLFEEGVSQQDTKSSIAWFQDWRDFYLQINPDTYTVGEVWTDTQIIAKYNQPTRGMQQYFMFDLAADILGGIYSPDPSRIMKSYLDTLEYFPDQQFATFLTNHDQQRVASYYGGRLQPQKLAAFVYLTGPGTPYIYYGEEIGMIGGKPDELIRKPMQWSPQANASFSDEEPWQEFAKGWEDTNVEIQNNDPESLLNWYKALVNTRNQLPALQKGSYLPFTSSCRRLYAVARIFEEQVVLVMANLGVQTMEDCTISIEESPLAGDYQVENVWGDLLFEQISFTETGALTDFMVAPVLEGGQTMIFILNK
ncbi:MAG: alpha-amylase family glycosyl hydrolase [Anaerolineaceae bacterium]|jgi:glycosidase|nr:alpha-amylase family glycosyl hydrolase [Anaerolineaceae bacterium]MDD4042999.1 alpha-amylase family glycosyl hydrolase [Anaerolineaceae bacterium]MDD4578240.1 alpha-amylase family glycosyl hydrolase [Anaerolineaceae bacterium]